MKILKNVNQEIYTAVNMLHKDNTDEVIIANYKILAKDRGYRVISAQIDRTNGVAPSLLVKVHPIGNAVLQLRC